MMNPEVIMMQYDERQCHYSRARIIRTRKRECSNYPYIEVNGEAYNCHY